MDKLVEIARFPKVAEAYMLRNLLEAEGIECSLRDEYTSQTLGGYVDIGGIKVEVMEDEVPHALEIMKANGYEMPFDNEETTFTPISEFVSKIPFLRKYSFEKQLFILLLVTTVLLAMLVYLGYFFQN